MNKKNIIISIIVIGLVIVSLLFLPEEKKEDEFVSVKKVDTVVLENREMSKYFKLTGQIKHDYEVYDQRLINQKVDEVLVKKGDSVTIGTPLIKLDQVGTYDNLNYQINQLKGTLSELYLSESQLVEERTRQEKLFEAGISSQNTLDKVNEQIKQVGLQISKIKASMEQLVKSKENISTKGIIYSSCSGLVTELTIDEQSYVSGDDMLKIKKDDGQYVRIDVTENVLEYLEVGKELLLVINGEKVLGFVDEILESEDLFYPVKIKVNQAFMAGLTVEVAIPTYINKNALVLNDRAIIKYKDETYVYCVEGDKAVKKDLEIGITRMGYTEILSGLDKRHQIIIKGQYSVYEGQKVEAVLE